VTEPGRGGDRAGAVLAGALVVLVAFYVFFRREMLDEGWYLLAGRRAWQGRVPILDFAYFQAPLLPYLYGISQKVAPGVTSGRILAALLTLGTAWLTLRLTRRVAGGRAVPWAAAGLLGCVYFLSHFPLALTYAPGAFLLLASLDAAVRGRALAAMLLATAATGVRLSLAPTLPILALHFARRGQGARAAAGLLIAAAVAALFVLPDPAVARFCLLGYHVEGATAADRIGAVSRSLAGTLASTGPWLAAAVVAPFVARDLAHRALLGAVFGAVLLANLVPATTAPYYQSVLAPLAAVLAAPVLAGLRSRPAAAAVLAALAVLQGWTALRSDVVVAARGGGFPLSERLSALRDVGRAVAAHSPADAPVWTLATYFALEADRDVLPGLEMSIFAVQPAWSRARAERFHVVNPGMLRDWIEDRVPDVVVLTALDVARLGGRDGPVLSALPERYEIRRRWDDVGQFDGPVLLLVRRGAGDSP